MGVRKLYKKHQAKKEAEGAGAEGSETIPQEKKKHECPNCRETKKIDFHTTPEQGRMATCLKCGSQWKLD